MTMPTHAPYGRATNQVSEVGSHSRIQLALSTVTIVCHLCAQRRLTSDGPSTPNRSGTPALPLILPIMSPRHLEEISHSA